MSNRDSQKDSQIEIEEKYKPSSVPPIHLYKNILCWSLKLKNGQARGYLLVRCYWTHKQNKTQDIKYFLIHKLLEIKRAICNKHVIDVIV